MKREKDENAEIQPAEGMPSERGAFPAREHTFEDCISPFQDLTFVDAEKEFRLRGIPFGLGEKRDLGLVGREGCFTNLALFLSDQCPLSIRERTFGRDDIFSLPHERREFAGSLFRQMRDVSEFLEFRNQLYSEIHGLYRVERRDYPEEAVREGIVNVLVHRNYSFPTFSKIGLFEDRIEILSAGGLPPGMELAEAFPGRSCPRNPGLLEVFRRLGLAEAAGSGIPRILRSYEGMERKPFFRTTENTFLLVLPNRNYPVDGKVAPIPG